MDETLKSAVVATVIDLVKTAKPDVHLVPKYGGTVFVIDPGVPEAQGLKGGVFAYRDHVSVEFSQGVGFDDPGSVLEGKGKARRHVKLRALSDIDDKTVAAFLTQALAS